MNRRVVWITAAVVISGCATFAETRLEQRFGPAAPRDRVVETVAQENIDYWNDVTAGRRAALRRLPCVLRRAVPAEDELDRGY